MSTNPYNDRPEGGTWSTLAHHIRRLGYNDGDTTELGTVTAPSPKFRIKIDGMTKLEFEHDDFIVAQHVTPLEVGDRVIIVCKEGNQQYLVIGKVA